MTQQGQRQQRFRGWANTKLTYDGDTIAAAQAITGETGLDQAAALHRICASVIGLQGGAYDPERPLMDYLAAAATAVGVPDGWDSVGDDLPVEKPLFLPTTAYQGFGLETVDFGTLFTQTAGTSLSVSVECYVISHSQKVRGIAAAAVNFTGTVVDTSWRVTIDTADKVAFDFNNGAAFVSVVSAAVAPVGRWFNVTATFSSGTVELFVDGISEGTAAAATPTVYSPTPQSWVLGSPTGSADQMQLSTVAVAITATTVLDAYLNEGSGTVCVNNAGANGTISNAVVHQPVLADA